MVVEIVRTAIARADLVGVAGHETASMRTGLGEAVSQLLLD